MNDFALGWKIFLFVAELILFVWIAVKSAKLQAQEEREFLAEARKQG